MVRSGSTRGSHTAHSPAVPARTPACSDGHLYGDDLKGEEYGQANPQGAVVQLPTANHEAVLAHAATASNGWKRMKVVEAMRSPCR